MKELLFIFMVRLYEGMLVNLFYIEKFLVDFFKLLCYIFN